MGGGLAAGRADTTWPLPPVIGNLSAFTTPGVQAGGFGAPLAGVSAGGFGAPLAGVFGGSGSPLTGVSAASGVDLGALSGATGPGGLALGVVNVAAIKAREEAKAKAEGKKAEGAAAQGVSLGTGRTGGPAPADVPAEYRPTLEAAAAQYGLDPTLLAAQIKQESGFNPAARSPAGAQGISQFMPATAAQYGVNPADPHSSIQGQARYMNDLLKQYNGDQTLALVAYNGGGGAVAAWQAGRPYAESRAYVSAVTANQQAYHQQNAAASTTAIEGGQAAARTPTGTPFGGVSYNIAFDVGQRYSTPLPGGTTHHRGVDIVPQSGGLGTPVTALAGGTVIGFRQGGAQGNAVVLQAADGLYHAYFHLLDPSTLAPGTVVQPGQQIGRMGQSGSEGFPHLHLEVRRHQNGDDRADVIDPLKYFGLR
jgi:murein DD-endopeptidase MepM/ murein hydrolase activator NlpD